jgi:xanthine dehydrogenase accessory factor
MNRFREIVQFIRSGQPFALGLVLSAEGSTPREAGTRAIFEAEGRIHGTLGGGPVEAEAQRQAVEACRTGQARAFEFELAGDTPSGHEPICGGRMRVLLDPTASKDAGAYEAAALALERRERGVLGTTIRPDMTTAARWWAETSKEQVELAQGTDGSETLIEPVVPAPLLLIAGGGHVGQALAAQAAPIGFDITVLDDRPEFADAALFPAGTVTQCGEIAQTLGEQPIGADTYIVVVTRGHQYDAEALRACIRRPAAYIGMIGSRRKIALMREEFVASGWATAEEWDRVFAPIGVDIGAETVPEIATSIAAQLIAVRRRGREAAQAKGAMPR